MMGETFTFRKAGPFGQETWRLDDEGLAKIKDDQEVERWSLEGVCRAKWLWSGGRMSGASWYRQELRLAKADGDSLMLATAFGEGEEPTVFRELVIAVLTRLREAGKPVEVVVGGGSAYEWLMPGMGLMGILMGLFWILVPNPAEVCTGSAAIVGGAFFAWTFAPWRMRLPYTLDEAIEMIAGTSEADQSEAGQSETDQ